ncbi:hypothetical protein ACPZ19_22205 [Amycolatopsis lurida]
MTVALLVTAGLATAVVVVCETLLERKRRWTAWFGAAFALLMAVAIIGPRIAGVPWLLGPGTALMVVVAIWRVTQLRRTRPERTGRVHQ